MCVQEVTENRTAARWRQFDAGGAALGEAIMGHTQSRPTTDGTTVSLDELGGFYRPAVLRKHELDTKSQWLGEAVLVQADKMERELHLKGTRTKEQQLAGLGGPTESVKRMGFGNTMSTPSRQQLNKAALQGSGPSLQGSGPSAKAPQSPGRPATAGQALRSSDPGPLTPIQQGGARPGTSLPGASRLRLEEPPSNSKDPYVKTSLTMGPAARRRKKEAAAAAKAAKQADELFKANHWRRRVDHAKRRVYLLLRGYMAWMSILKKKRVGYADPLPVDVLPMVLSNVLKELTNTVGEHLVACGGLVSGTQEASAKLAALTGGRLWMARSKTPRSHTEPNSPTHHTADSQTLNKLPSRSGNSLTSLIPLLGGGTPNGLTQPLSLVLSPHGSPPAHSHSSPFLQLGASLASPTSASPFARPFPPPESPGGLPSLPANRRAGARSLVQVGAGAHALEQAGRGVVKPLLLQPGFGMEERYDNSHKVAATHATGVDAVRRLTALYIQNTHHRNKVSTRESTDLANMMKQQQVHLQVIANKANSRWVEKHITDTAEDTKGGWSAPTVLDTRTLQAGGVDMVLYQKSVGVLLSEGRVAMMLTYLGEDTAVAVDRETGLETYEPAIQCDPWRAVQQLFPHKMPNSPYLSGLTVLDRRVLQIVLDCEKRGGAAAVAALTVLVAVDSVHTAWVAEQALAKGHWSLQSHQVIIVSIARLPGMLWDPPSKTFKLNYAGAGSYLSAGTGYAHLALAWPSHSFTMTDEGRAYVAGSVLHLLAAKGVQYVYSTLLCDLEAINPATQGLDPAFVGPALYAFDVHGANMAMQVVSTANDQVARVSNSVVLSPSAGKMFSCSVTMSDVQSAATRPILNKQITAGSVVSCMSRYFMSLQGLQAVLTGPNAFHIKAVVNMPCMHIELDVADLTSHTGAQCVAISSKGKGPMVHVKTLTKEWLRDFVPCLVSQDAQPGMRQRLGRITALARLPSMHMSGLVSGLTVSGRLNSALTGPLGSMSPTTPRGGQAGAKIMLFVRDNAASRMAFKVALSFLGGRDVLHIFTVVPSEMNESDAQPLLSSFSDVMADQQINRRVIRQRDRLVDTMASEVELLVPDVVIIGSGALSKLDGAKSGKNLGHQVSMGAGLSTSVAMSLVKAITDTPVLVVKTSSAGELLAESGAGAGCKKVMCEVATSSGEALKWLCPRLTPDRDKLLLVRPYGIGKDGKETPVSQRMTAAYATEAQFFRLNPKKVPMMEGPGEGFAQLALAHKVDVLTLMSPNARVTPPHILELLRTARTNVLVWRQHGSAPQGM